MKDLYTKAAAVAVPIVHGVRDDQLDNVTPCAEFDVRDLLNHLFQVVVEFQKAARHEDMDFATPPDYLHGDWRERFATEIDSLSQAWSRPGALDGPVKMLPRALLARLPVFDLTVHGWDLARATGRPFTADAGLIAEVEAVTRQFAEQGRKLGQFGEPVAVPEDAPAVDRLVGLVGRDPAWKP